MPRKSIQLLGIMSLMACVIVLAFITADQISNNESARTIVEQFGIFGIFVLAIIGGFNVLIPVHAATFTPIFLAAGFSMSIVIITLVIGTTVADLISYYIGKWSKKITESNYPVLQSKIEIFAHKHKKLIFPGIFFYSAFIPFPNEIMLIPLGLMGFRLWRIITPLVLGTFLNQIIFSFGFVRAFELLF